MGNDLKISGAIFWTAVYFAVMLFYTGVDVALWRKAFPRMGSWLNIVTIVVCICGYLSLLKRTGFQMQLFSKITASGILAAVGCSVFFYLALDCCLDPVFERLFPASEQAYQEAIASLRRFPVTSFLQICVIAPVIEELLMRAFVLGGLRNTYGAALALLVSSALFAILHFNMVQTLSALLCGVVLGLLYLKTGSVFCCIVGHCGYNVLSYISMIYGMKAG